ncbi:MAG: RnfABCDGE type electron transport complex subunit G [Proteobacteria bacterium]|nr:RnfABCDGE type electron transport complex subunit G [Pseudomonadota bacterium]
MPETAKMIIVLTVISGLASLGLAAFNAYTMPSIRENERQYTLRSIKKVIPKTNKPNPCKKSQSKFDNNPDQDAVCVKGTTVYRGRAGDKLVGLAIITEGDKAYSGTITCLVGISLDGVVTGVEVLKHAETPGLGAKIEECTWRRQLIGKRAEDMVWKVAKDGGKVDQISGATISSRSMIDAVKKARKLLDENREEIVNGKPMKQGEVCDAS